MRRYGKAFPFTSITINNGFGGSHGGGELHRDAGNIGPSLVRALNGEGKLRYYPEDDDQRSLGGLDPYDALSLDPSKDWVLMNGCRAHAVDSVKGDCYSVVVFSNSKYRTAPPAT